MSKKYIYASLIVLVLLISSINIFAQFGKNKVQYRKFDWRFIETEHFDVYYDAGSKALAEFAAVSAEKALVSIQNTLNYKFSMRIALIVYDSHNDFQQTNVTGGYLPEGVGGFTELFKNRVVVPFQGSYSQLRHVIHHELVHAVLNDMFYGGTLQSALMTSNNFQIPLWLNEGLCEYESLGGLDIETDMFMRDLTISEKLPSLRDLDGYLAYRGGQTFYWFVAEKYGKAKVTEFLNKLYINKNLEQTFQSTFNMSLRDFSDMWEREIKKIYWPDLKIFEDPRDFALKLTDRRDIGNFYNTSPAISPNGDQFAYISDRDDGIFAVYVQDVDAKARPRKLVSSLRKQDFEDLNLLTPGIAWDPTGQKLAISAKSGGEDAIFIVDAKTGRYERLFFGLRSISSVSWSKDGRYIAFIASEREESNIYTYDFDTKSLQKVTDDIFSVSHIAWGNNNNEIFFVSDRHDILDFGIKSQNFKMWKHKFETSDIYKLYIKEQQIQRITYTPQFNKTSLLISNDGNKLLYVSDNNGIGNIYVYDFVNNIEYPITNSLTGITQISLSQDNSKLLFASQIGGGYDIFLLRLPFERRKIDSLPLTQFRKKQIERTSIVQQAISNQTISNNLISTENHTQIQGYGEFEIDFSAQQLVEPNQDVIRSSSFSDMSTKGANIENQEFVERIYKITFSPDIILVNPGYSTYYGWQGLTQMLFSDVLGDHQIYAGLNLFTDLKNSQFYLSYSYLPNLIDYHIAVYHYPAYFYKYDNIIDDYSLYRFRNYGLSILTSLPFDLFTRVEWGADFIGAEMTNLDYSFVPGISRFIFLPQARFVYDNSLGGWYAPERGFRGYFEILGSPKFNSNSVGFMSVKTDLRQYFKISNFISLAMRGSMGASFGPNPQRYFLGGTENWINYSYSNRDYPFENPEDFVFMNNFIMPVRGWDIAAIRGNKFFVSNTELRFPLFYALVAGPVPVLLQGVMSTLFFDIGGAWTDDFKISKIDANGKRVPADMIFSSGTGVRSYLLGLPVKLDIAWSYNYTKWSKPRYMFSLGFDF